MKSYILNSPDDISPSVGICQKQYCPKSVNRGSGSTERVNWAQKIQGTALVGTHWLVDFCVDIVQAGHLHLSRKIRCNESYAKIRSMQQLTWWADKWSSCKAPHSDIHRQRGQRVISPLNSHSLGTAFQSSRYPALQQYGPKNHLSSTEMFLVIVIQQRRTKKRCGN